jgi:hypothetical protein
MDEAWVLTAKDQAARFREQASDLVKRAEELEECVRRVERFGREEREGPAWFDFEARAEE